MKKVLIIIGILLLTGCGKKLVCTSVNDDINEKYEVFYKGNDITNIKNEKTYKFKNKEQFKNFESIISYKVESTSTNNIKVSYKKKNNKYILISIYDTKNLNEKELNEFGLSNNIDNLKNIFDGYGLKCK